MRIIAGRYKGRRILSPPQRAGTRPMTGYVKESLFSMLEPWLPGAAVLDLYCGTGTMGLEALSRGAEHCWFAERDRRVLGKLLRNIEQLGADEACTVWRGDLTARLGDWLAEIDRPIDLAFVDPPYAAARQWSWETAATRIFAPLGEHLAGDGVIVLRLPAQVEAPQRLADLSAGRRRAYGDMNVGFYQHADKES